MIVILAMWNPLDLYWTRLVAHPWSAAFVVLLLLSASGWAIARSGGTPARVAGALLGTLAGMAALLLFVIMWIAEVTWDGDFVAERTSSPDRRHGIIVTSYNGLMEE